MALETYKEGLAELPVRTLPPALNLKGKEKATDEDETTEQPSEQAAAEAAEPREKTEDEIEQEKENAELSELRAILSANVAACLLKLVRLVHHLPVPSPSSGLTLFFRLRIAGKRQSRHATKRWRRRPTTPRRCTVERWRTSRSGAGAVCLLLSKVRPHLLLSFLALLTPFPADFNRLSSLPPTDTTPLLRQQIAEAKRRLPKKIEEQQQKEKDEVLGKLKDLGNTVLGAHPSPFPPLVDET